MSDSASRSTSWSAHEYYNVVRHQIEHEDNLIIQRLSWLVASQSFLFTAYAIVLNGLTASTAGTATEAMEQQMRVFRAIPVVAICTCGLIYVSILAAVYSMASLRRSYEIRAGGHQAELPDIQPQRWTRYCGLSAPLVLPLVFVAVWVFLRIRGNV